jgi:hypothetical protein
MALETSPRAGNYAVYIHLNADNAEAASIEEFYRQRRLYQL